MRGLRREGVAGVVEGQRARQAGGITGSPEAPPLDVAVEERRTRARGEDEVGLPRELRASRRGRDAPSDAEIERGLRERAVNSARDAEVLLRWRQAVRRPETTPGVGLDSLSEAKLEQLYVGLVRLGTMDETVLAALVEHVLAGEEPDSS
jgi:hypothetical protein